MAARPFQAAGDLPAPLTVEETIEKFDVPMATIAAARRVLANGSARKARTASSGQFTTKGRSRKPVASRKRRSR